MFAPLGDVAVDRLFGGWRYQLDGRAFAFFVGGALHFRVGPQLREVLEARGSRPFSYAKRNGRVMITRFMSAPDDDLEDEDALEGLGAAGAGRAGAGQRLAVMPPST